MNTNLNAGQSVTIRALRNKVVEQKADIERLTKELAGAYELLHQTEDKCTELRAALGYENRVAATYAQEIGKLTEQLEQWAKNCTDRHGSQSSCRPSLSEEAKHG